MIGTRMAKGAGVRGVFLAFPELLFVLALLTLAVLMVRAWDKEQEQQERNDRAAYESFYGVVGSETGNNAQGHTGE